MREFQEELAEAVENLDRRYSELKATARNRLGSLYNSADYPGSLRVYSPSSSTFPAWNRRTTCSNSTRSFTKRSAAACSPASTKRSADADKFPSLPETFTENRPGLLEAFTAAADSCDSDSVRFALGHVQVRGEHGSIVATDGRQLLVQGGFQFPWTSDLLVPRSKVFADLTRFLRRQVFPLHHLLDALVGCQGVAEHDFFHSRFRRRLAEPQAEATEFAVAVA
jgi:hypothetical protein